MRVRARGFAVLAVTASLTVVAVLAWSVVAPAQLQLRAAGALECRAAARLAADAELRRAVDRLDGSGRDAATRVPAEALLRAPEGPPACPSEESCYRIERHAEQFRIRAVGPACGGSRPWVYAGGVLAPCDCAGGEARVRWRRWRHADSDQER